MKHFLRFLVSISLLGGSAALAQTPAAMPAAGTGQMSTSSAETTTRTTSSITASPMPPKAGTKSTKSAAPMSKSRTSTATSPIHSKMKADDTPDRRYYTSKTATKTTKTKPWPGGWRPAA